MMEGKERSTGLAISTAPIADEPDESYGDRDRVGESTSMESLSREIDGPNVLNHSAAINIDETPRLDEASLPTEPALVEVGLGFAPPVMDGEFAAEIDACAVAFACAVDSIALIGLPEKSEEAIVTNAGLPAVPPITRLL